MIDTDIAIFEDLINNNPENGYMETLVEDNSVNKINQINMLNDTHKHSDLILKDYFIDKYMETVKSNFPFISKSEERELRNRCNINFIDKDVSLSNSYTTRDKIIKASRFLDEIYKKKLILIENGCLFMYPEDYRNIPPSIEVEDFYGFDRDEKKNLKKHFSDPKKGNDPVKAEYYDNEQLTDKLNMNTFYGLTQPITSPHFNPSVPPSITCRGRTMISVCGLATEAACCGYFPLKLEGIVNTIRHIVAEKTFDGIVKGYKFTIDDAMDNIGIDETYYGYKVIHTILSNLTQIDINKICIKNNMRRFVNIPVIQENMNKILTKLKETQKPFINPYNPKDVYGIKEYIDIIKSYVPLLYGFYYYQGDYDSQYNNTVFVQGTIKAMNRRAVALIDTDSVMASLYSTKKIIEESYPLLQQMDFTPKDTKFTLANLAIFILDKVIDYSLDIYKDRVHIPEEKKWRVAMKNEYFYSSFSLTSRKKNYAALKDIQEGVVFKKPKLDVKGLMFIKSVVNGNLGAEVEGIIENLVLRPEKISGVEILKALRRLADGIEKKLKSDEGHEIFVPEKLNEPLLNVLDNQARAKSVEMYNVIYPTLGLTDKINTPSRFLTIKCDYTSDIQMKYPETYARVLAYSKIHNIHSLLKKILTFNTSQFVTRYMDKYQGDISYVAERLSYSILPEFINKLIGNIPDLLMFKNGYKGSGAKGFSRDEIFYKQLELSDNDISKLNDRLDNILLILKDEFKGLNLILKDLAKENLGYFKYEIKGIEDFTRLSIPESLTENLPRFISEVLDTTKDVIMADNLAAPIIERVNLVCMRTANQKINVTNIINYF